jgi:hypothetical protein
MRIVHLYFVAAAFYSPLRLPAFAFLRRIASHPCIALPYPIVSLDGRSSFLPELPRQSNLLDCFIFLAYQHCFFKPTAFIFFQKVACWMRQAFVLRENAKSKRKCKGRCELSWPLGCRDAQANVGVAKGKYKKAKAGMGWAIIDAWQCQCWGARCCWSR